MKFNSIELLNLQRNITFIKYLKLVLRQATMSKMSFLAQEKSCFSKPRKNKKMKKKTMTPNNLLEETQGRDLESLKQVGKLRRREDAADILHFLKCLAGVILLFAYHYT